MENFYLQSLVATYFSNHSFYIFAFDLLILKYMFIVKKKIIKNTEKHKEENNSYSNNYKIHKIHLITCTFIMYTIMCT